MSNPSFGSSNLFGAGSAANTSPSAGAGASTSYAPQLGLRQRHHSSATTNGNGSSIDENANPNKNNNNMTTAYSKWGGVSKVRAPPRMSLATGTGKSAFGRSATAAAPQRQQQPSTTESNNNRSNNESNQRAAALPSMNGIEEDLSLWVIGYGYRNEAHFRALYHRLESCGTITARRGGLSCFGESKNENDDTTTTDNGNNWVAVRYESALCAHKALCQHGNFVSIGGSSGGSSTMVIGVMPLNESDAAAKLGINTNPSPQEGVKLLSSHSYNNNNNRNRGELRSEADILLYGDNERRGDAGIIENEIKSGLDSLCGKVLAWFFMWDTQA
ncbi:hypothetical protein ACHAXR_003373 [Thalassiosira sp. AJA248-18]